MIRRSILTVVLAAAVLSGATQQARADFGDALAGIIVGGAIVNAINQQPRPRRHVVTNPAWEQTRDMQTALNFFFFNVGTPDGVAGRNTRNGIAQYQAYLSFPATGEMTEFQRQVLMTSYQRAQMGTPQSRQIAATHPDGMRGILLAVRDEMLGVNQPAPAPARPTK